MNVVLSSATDVVEPKLPSSSTMTNDTTTLVKKQVSTDTQPTMQSSFSSSLSSSFGGSMMTADIDEHDDGKENVIQEPLHINMMLMDVNMEDHLHHHVDVNCKATADENDIHAHYEILPRIIGEGQFGIVRECIQLSTGKEFAVKSIRKVNCSSEILKREVDLLDYAASGCRHKGIVNLIDVFEDCRYFHIITELCRGGELFDRIAEQIDYQQQQQQQQQQRSTASTDVSSNTTTTTTTSRTTLFSEEYAAGIVASMLDSVAYLHDRDIVHRDLKPENFLFEHKSNKKHDEQQHSGQQVKLIDFGLAVTHDEHYDAPMTDVVGTPYYMAPELLKKSYTKACDIWSIGVITYILLCGRPPFDGCDDEEVFANIRRGRFDLDNVADNMSNDAKDFIKCLLKRDPRRRSTAEDALQHPWIVTCLKGNL